VICELTWRVERVSVTKRVKLNVAASHLHDANGVKLRRRKAKSFGDQRDYVACEASAPLK